MKKNLFLLLVAFCLLVFKSYSQSEKIIIEDKQVWLGYFNQTRVSEKWGLWLDFGYRSNNEFVKSSFQSLVRPGVTYYINNNLRLSAGYAYFFHYPGITNRTVGQPEHRIWEQVQWTQKFKKFSLRQAVRIEQRYRKKYADNDHLSSEYGYNNRIRYNLGVLVPLFGVESQPKSLSLIIGNELMINFGRQVLYNYFDQNRIYGGLGYQLTKDLNINLLYINIFQQLSSGNNFNHAHVLRLIILHNLDLRKDLE